MGPCRESRRAPAGRPTSPSPDAPDAPRPWSWRRPGSPQLVELAPGTLLETVEFGPVASEEAAVGEVVLGEQASLVGQASIEAAAILPTALPRTGGAPLGGAAALAAAVTLAGIAVRRRPAR